MVDNGTAYFKSRVLVRGSLSFMSTPFGANVTYDTGVSVNAGGCSGFSYVWETTDKEAHVENLHIDPIAEMYVIGCTIDFVTELGGSFLKVTNPNATASCGCGESFAV